MRDLTKVLADITVIAFLFLPGCGTAAASNCSVMLNKDGELTATVILQNRFKKRIVRATILFDTANIGPSFGNRLFELVGDIEAGDKRTIQGRPLDQRNDYSFKFKSSASKGCEVESVMFADGTSWEQGVPFI